MNESEEIELAKAYVALSNAHMLELVLPMFAESATYRSSHVGEFNGRSAIGEMMGDFFRRFPDVYWNVLDYLHAGKNTVSFDFEMTATEMLTGDLIERKGVEHVQFTDDGLISYLEVKK